MSNNRKQQIENTEKASVTNVIFPLILIMLFFFAFAKSAKSQVAYVKITFVTDACSVFSICCFRLFDIKKI